MASARLERSSVVSERSRTAAHREAEFEAVVYAGKGQIHRPWNAVDGERTGEQVLDLVGEKAAVKIARRSNLRIHSGIE